MYRAYAFVIGGFLSFGTSEEANGTPSSVHADRVEKRFYRSSSYQTVAKYRFSIGDEEYHLGDPACRVYTRAI